MDVVKDLKYQTIRQIGVGAGMNSTVYEALDEIGRTVAVKVIQKANLDRMRVTDYFAEAKRMSEARHENVVPIITAASNSAEVDLMMPLYRAGSAGDRVNNGPMSLREARRVGLGTLQGLAAIHVAGILHFDLKPSNVLFSDTDQPMVADFGQSRMLGPLGVATTPPMYPEGFPPEMYNLGVGTVESDIYLAGLTLYRLVNGDPFFKGQLVRQVAKHGHDLEACIAAGDLVDLRRFQPHVPARLRTIIRTAMSADPGRRYPTANHLSDALGQCGIETDWSMLGSVAGLVWRGTHPTRSPVIVEATLDGIAKRWSVSVFTEGAAGRRSKGRKDFWRKNMSDHQVEEHLRRAVFPNL